MKFLEIIKIALGSLRANKLRSSLTVLGIVVGIFSIISISTIISMLQVTVESGLSMLSKNTFQIQKFPAMRMGRMSDQIRNRKDITLEDYYALKERMDIAEYVGAEMWDYGQLLKFRDEQTNPNVQVCGATPEALFTNQWIVENGRAINNNDVEHNSRVIILGYDVAVKLFRTIDPIGQEIKVDGMPLKVIGVFESRGQMFGQSRDNFAVMPISLFQSHYGKYHRSVNITVMAFNDQMYDATIEAAVGAMRAIRKVPPGQDNDFDIFSNESMIEQMNSITGIVKIISLVIAMISLLAAGIGIMNIMLVSVTERTREIGIRKAIGAKKMNILWQFVIEAITLCQFGGIIGIVLGVGIGNLVGSLLNAVPTIPLDWVFIGVMLCVIVGVVFGTYPAYKAANLDPIEALRYE
jgi:putative ABC transport system permease protein